MRFWALVVGLLVWAGAGAAPAQELSALARLVPGQSGIVDRQGGVAVDLALSQPVPWRVRVLDAPPRLVLDMREVDWTGLSGVVRRTDAVVDMRAGVVRQGWSRLVMELSGPHLVTQAGMVTGEGGAQVRLMLEPAGAAEFAAAAALPEPEGWALPVGADLPRAAAPRGTGPLVVVLDPGHGGIDPGAERDGLTEAGLMLTFARELKDLLLRDGGFIVILTREEDVFVPLEARISIARAAGAHVFLSLHADAIAEGEAVGATLYTLSDEASDAASQALAERHDRADLLSGVDLTAQDDLVATILMDMARTETGPRIERLALALEGAIKAAGLRMHRHPRQTAGFSVLKSPDIPSLLVELGFMSSSRDLARLTDPEWRATMALALRDGLKAWAAEDAALSALQR
ncbi:MAG: N-acetylmuramoyl-L-alanine amidase [Pseudotabrizicola sp.]|uniref:N-acetylmuramoyl-L-alanine amidase family protein n=1 Tax=Pseudotabrizicola sp. TaxID=2939647 RepID=UPI0027160813|nr:N-acetylmuramoyl-L-alanine amidase [Pseudotabrizicola sp.]MDO9638761.1 N-acetylmuramoyl-L-alanine amidase [Pseudotabrizicola sp.]